MIPGVWMRGGTNTPLHAVMVVAFVLHVIIAVIALCGCRHPYTVCGVLGAVVAPYVVSWSWSSHHVGLWLWWLSLCCSCGHCCLYILVATLLPHIITIVPLLLRSVVSGCAVVGPRGRGWLCIHRQGW
jgi:hypothetical protein